MGAPRPDEGTRMLNAPEPACLVIADITGYTSYLAGVELDHAQDILADLMDTVVDRAPADVPAGQARPPLTSADGCLVGVEPGELPQPRARAQRRPRPPRSPSRPAPVRGWCRARRP